MRVYSLCVFLLVIFVMTRCMYSATAAITRFPERKEFQKIETEQTEEENNNMIVLNIFGKDFVYV